MLCDSCCITVSGAKNKIPFKLVIIPDFMLGVIYYFPSILLVVKCSYNQNFLEYFIFSTLIF